jgi:Flp pilus assembly protein TadD
MSRGDYNGAGDMLGVLARQQPNNAEVRYLHGDVLFRAHDMFGASGEIRAAVRLAPRNTEYLNRLADVQIGLGDRNAAVASLRQILVIRPGDAGAQRRIDQITGTHTAPAPQPAAAPANPPRAAQPASGTTTTRRNNDNGGVQMFGAPARTNGGTTTRSGSAGTIRR